MAAARPRGADTAVAADQKGRAALRGDSDMIGYEAGERRKGRPVQVAAEMDIGLPAPARRRRWRVRDSDDPGAGMLEVRRHLFIGRDLARGRGRISGRAEEDYQLLSAEMAEVDRRAVGEG